MRGVAGIFVGALCAAAIACSASHKSAAVAPVQPEQHPMGGSAGDAHSQIEQLASQIDAQRAQMALPEPPHVATMSAHATPMSNTPNSRTDNQCHPGTSDTCQDSCKLADSICESAQKICNLAQQLPGDAWASGKCESGKSTCDAAHQKCCGCQL